MKWCLKSSDDRSFYDDRSNLANAQPSVDTTVSLGILQVLERKEKKGAKLLPLASHDKARKLFYRALATVR